MKILYDFKSSGDKWENGKILDPANGNVYSSTVWLMNEKTLKVRGYLGPFYRSQVWRRQNDFSQSEDKNFTRSNP